MKTTVDSLHDQEDEFRPNAMTLQALIAPVVAVLLIFVGVVLLFVLTGTRVQDEAEVRRSLQLVESAFEVLGTDLGRLAIGQGRSDQAVKKFLTRFDRTWAHSRMEPIHGQFSDAGIIVIGADDSLVYADGGSPGIVNMERRHDFVQRARDLPVSPPDAIAGFTTINGALYVAAASIIAPAVATPDDTSRKGVLILLVPVSDSLLAKLSREYLVDNLRVEMPPDIAATFGMRIEPPEGGTMAVITWTPAAPGQQLFDYLLVPILVASLLASLLLATFLRTAMRTAQQLKKGAAALAESGVELEHSETKLAAIIDGVADSIITFDENGLVTSANASTQRIFGYGIDEMLGQPADMLIMDGPKAVNANRAARVLRADPSADETEYRDFSGCRKDGGRFNLDTAISHITYRSATIAVAIMRDVTERRRAEETLNLLSTGMALVDRDCRLLLANRSASRLLDLGDGLTLSHGRLGATRRGQMEQLRELVDRACFAEDRDGAKATFAGVMTIDRDGDVRPLSIMVAPVQMSAETQGNSQVAAIFIRDLEVRQSVPPEILAKLFGLTPAEARVVVELVKGKRPQEVADDLNVSLNTVRNQLKHIFSKTNTGRQSELISLVLSSAAFVSEHGLVIDEDDDSARADWPRPDPARSGSL
ncbi:MAG: PAS domain S-box protein [Alphaproteobacteria bacterium]|nr:PAS domain S-box protein [Alphaproteobacteria bacterium]